MPGSFTFANDFTTTDFLSQTRLSKGAGNGIDNVNLFHALGGAFTFDNNTANIVPIALIEGQTMRLDIDFGASNNIDTINTEIRVVDALGHEVAINDDATILDNGSSSLDDSRLSFLAPTTGLYYVVVTQKDNDYVDNTYGFNNGGTDTGVFQLDIAIGGLAALSQGTNGADSLSLGTNETRFNARGGDDYITANIGNTVIDGARGADSLNGNTGRDILFGGEGNDNLSGSGNRDVLVGGEEDDYLNGGLGNDQLFGDNGADNLYGDAGNDLLDGGRGSDQLDGGLNKDTVRAGAGGDSVYLQLNDGNDILDGGEGSDYLGGSSVNGALHINLSLTTAQDTKSCGVDIITGFETVYGSNVGNDVLTGDNGQNTLSSSGGNDTLAGSGGNDYLDGGAGDDRMFGDAGIDTLLGQAGRDALFGGADSDTFYFYNLTDSTVATPDVIRDFSHTELDHIGLSNLPGTLVFHGYVGFDAGSDPELIVAHTGTAGIDIVHVDTTGDNVSDMDITVVTAADLLASDFYL